MKALGIFGTSGFSREAADIGRELGYSPFYIARDESEMEAWTGPETVMLENEVLQSSTGVSFAIGIGDNAFRKKVANRFIGTLEFINLIHPSASFGHGQLDLIHKKIGVLVCAGVRFTNNIEIGNFTIFNLNATIGHGVVIEDYVNVSPGANISGNVFIGSGCWIGTGSAINQGSDDGKLLIGQGTTIGSGSVVVRDCESDAVYVGIPAKRIK